MLNFDKIRKNAKQFLSITSLTVEKFDELLPYFESEWNNYITNYTLDGLARVHAYVPSENSFLPRIEQKLFFVLAYQKNASLQEFFAASFDTNQACCNQYIHILSPILKNSLSKFAPKRQIEEVNFEEGQTYIGDATERAVQRDTYEQSAYYSGKKKRHTIKNMVFCSLLGVVLFLSPTVCGRIHDKTIAQTLDITQQNITFYVDLAYLDWEPNPTAKVILPHKKPRNSKNVKRELTQQQKEFNKEASKIRVKVENVFAHVKTMRILKDTIRNYKKNFKDLVMLTAVTLYNFRNGFVVDN